MSGPDQDRRDFRERRSGPTVRGRSGAIRNPVPFQNKGDAQMCSVLPTVVLLEARYEIIANKSSHSFTAMIAGSLDRATGLAVLDGTVTAGWLTGKAVHVEFRVIACTQAPDHTCFQGTIRVIKASQTDNDDNDD